MKASKAELREEIELLESAVGAAKLLADQMQTCHICRSYLVVDYGPSHCENCSDDCDFHDEAECVSIGQLHRMFLMKWDAIQRRES